MSEPQIPPDMSDDWCEHCGAPLGTPYTQIADRLHEREAKALRDTERIDMLENYAPIIDQLCFWTDLDPGGAGGQPEKRVYRFVVHLEELRGEGDTLREAIDQFSLAALADAAECAVEELQEMTPEELEREYERLSGMHEWKPEERA